MQMGARWAAVPLLAIGMAVAAACSNDDSGSGGDGTDVPGAAVYRANCASCHAPDGGGGRGPRIGDGVAADKYDVTEMTAIVTDGRGSMPSFDGRLSETEIDDVVGYVRDHLGREAEEDTPTTEPGEAERGSLEGYPPEVVAAIDTGDWPVANGDLHANRARPDSSINSETVERLELAWSYDVPGDAIFGSLTTTALVSDDTVYLGDLSTKVHAIDRETGEQRFVAGDDASIFGPTGVALGWGRLYGTKGDDDGGGKLLVAYDADSGEELWSTDLGANGSDINVQPVAYGGLVFASTGGYGAGTRATIYAVDAETGDIVWDFPVIEDPDLWGHPDLNSGGGVWYPATIDADRGVAYFGTGNPYPFPGAPGFPNGASRPGSNRWTNSALALDIETGELVWGHQALERDIFDRDAMLTSRVDVEEEGGEERSLLISTGKLGVVFGLDADTGERLWSTPVGTHENDELTEIEGPTLVYPGSLGGVQTPLAITDGTIYACVMNAPSMYEGPEESSFGFSVRLGTADSDFVAIDAATGEIDWSVKLPGDALGGATVAGDLVFTSTFGGQVLALDRTTGETVWTYQAAGGINGWITATDDELYVPVGTGETPQLLKFRLGEA